MLKLDPKEFLQLLQGSTKPLQRFMTIAAALHGAAPYLLRDNAHSE